MNRKEPMVGIYWLIGRRLIVFASPAAQVPVVGGYRDYPRGHDEVWAEVKRLFPLLHGREYWQVPRGRVLWVEATANFRILGPTLLIANSRKIEKITRAFLLGEQHVEFMADLHYDPPGDLEGV